MPIVWTRDDTCRCFLAKVSGVLSVEEVLAGIPVYRVGEFREYALLVDAREGTTNATAADVRTIVTRISEASKDGARGRVAIVATSPMLFGMARMYELMSDNAGIKNIAVFRAMEEAYRWLDVTP